MAGYGCLKVDTFELGLPLAPRQANPGNDKLKMIHSERPFLCFYIQLTNICRDNVFKILKVVLLNALHLFSWKYTKSAFYVLGKFLDAF